MISEATKCLFHVHKKGKIHNVVVSLTTSCSRHCGLADLCTDHDKTPNNKNNDSQPGGGGS